MMHGVQAGGVLLAESEVILQCIAACTKECRSKDKLLPESQQHHLATLPLNGFSKAKTP